MRALLISALLLGVLPGCAHTPTYDPADPLEPVNRGIYKFNTVADKYLLRPVAVAYEWTIPGIARTGVNNFFANLFYPVTIVNQLLQGKPVLFFADTARLIVNTTIGIGGLIDVAKHIGLPRHSEDFGQTFGRWGVGQGWYLMLPFWGPSTNRDLVGSAFDAPLSPLYWEDDVEIVWSASVLNAVQTRAQLLKADRLLEEQLDPYVFIRSSYLQQRRAAVYDGKPPDEDEELDFDAFED